MQLGEGGQVQGLGSAPTSACEAHSSLCLLLETVPDGGPGRSKRPSRGVSSRCQWLAGLVEGAAVVVMESMRGQLG